MHTLLDYTLLDYTLFDSQQQLCLSVTMKKKRYKILLLFLHQLLSHKSTLSSITTLILPDSVVINNALLYAQPIVDDGR